jgi:hypothetical protein
MPNLNFAELIKGHLKEVVDVSEQLPVTTWHLSCYKPLVASPVRPDASCRILSGSSGNPVRAER